jgi:hypothetical protein
MVNHRLPPAIVASHSVPPTDPLRFFFGDLARWRGGDPLLAVFLGATASFARFGFDGRVRNGRSRNRRRGATRRGGGRDLAGIPRTTRLGAEFGSCRPGAFFIDRLLEL